MRKEALFLLLLISSICFSQANKIVFTYDLAGNQSKRSLCLNCPSTTGKNAVPKEIAELSEEDMVKMSERDVFSFYPNPVKEELYIKWENTGKQHIENIQVFSINGQLLAAYENISKTYSQNISFQSYPTGVYVILLYYSNGEQNSIKIIKQ
jgi:hypothetical protein